jgi:Cu-processing system ATP-binding protein
LKNNVIEVRNAFKYYGEVLAVDGVTLTVHKGETLGLIGHNGAGKSTLFKMLLGLIPPTSGDIHINGTPVRGGAFRELRRSIGYLPENVVFYDNLTGLETLQFFAALKGCDRPACLPLLEKVGLAQAATRRVDGYSKGMRQRLGFAQALLGKPRILFLDEPTTGLDPEGIREFYQVLHELNDQGVTVVITSHILSEIQERVQRLAVMKSGRLHALGTVQELREAVDLPLVIRLRLQCSRETLAAALQGVALEN